MNRQKFLISLVFMSALLLGGIAVFSRSAGVSALSFAQNDAPSHVWNHYEKVAPTYYRHGSKEFWANCTELGYVLEEPAQGIIHEGPSFDSTPYFDELTELDARYIAPLADVSAHHFSEEWSVDENTGTHYHACIDEGYEYLRIDEAAHQGEYTTVDPTETEDGYKFLTCDVCGYVGEHEFSGFSAGTYDKIEFSDFGYIYAVRSKNRNISGDVVIPSYYRGKRVGRIGYPGFRDCTDLKSMTFTDSIMEISESAFDGSRGLAQIHYRGTSDGWIDIKGKENILDVTSVHLYFDGSEKETTFFRFPLEKGAISEYAFYQCAGLRQFVIPDGITSIGNNAFKGCAKLTNMYLPVSAIPNSGNNSRCGYYSIHPDYSDKTIIFLTGQGAIPQYGLKPFSGKVNYAGALEGWLNVTGKEYLPETVHKLCFNTLYGVPIQTKEIVIPEGYNAIDDYAFYNADITSITVPETVTTCGENAFVGCNITKATIPECVCGKFNSNNLTELTLLSGAVPADAFKGSTKLTSLTLGDGVTEIGEDAFADCNSLNEVVIGENVTSLGAGSFVGCTNLARLTVPAALLGYDKDYRSTLREIVSHRLERLTITGQGEIGLRALAEFDLADEIVVSEGITSIDRLAFLGNDSLLRVSLPSTLSSIGYDAFVSCSEELSINYHGSTTQWLSLSGKANLLGEIHLYLDGSEAETTDVVIPQGTTSLGGYTFAHCPNIRSITIPSSVSFIGTDCFAHSPLLTEVLCKMSAESYFALAGKVNANGVTLKLYLDGAAEETIEFAIPEGVTEIAENALANCNGITTLVIPSTVSSIATDVSRCMPSLERFVVDEDNLNYASLDGVLYNKDKTTLVSYPRGKADTEFTIPSGVTTVSTFAFMRVDHLQRLVIPSWVTKMEAGFVVDAPALSEIFVNENNLNYCSNDGILYDKDITELICCPSGKTGEGIIVPPTVSSILGFAFSYCSLDAVLIAKSVTSINAFSFYGTDDSTTIIYGGTVAELTAAIKTLFFGWQSNITHIQCSDGIWSPA